MLCGSSPLLLLMSIMQSGGEKNTHASVSAWMVARTIGRGFTVSRFPRGICRTRLIVLGMEVTIREPRSTRRRSLPTSVLASVVARRGAETKCASCAKVVYTTKSPETVKEFAFCARARGEEDGVADNKVPEHVRPRKRDVADEVEVLGMSITRTTSQAFPKSTRGTRLLESISSGEVSRHRC
jgi:hypothetical protein